jgi:uncharacterized protein with PIN domain
MPRFDSDIRNAALRRNRACHAGQFSGEIALAKAYREPLLFKGADFGPTDLDAA